MSKRNGSVIRLQLENGKFSHMDASTPARFASDNAQGPVGYLGDFDDGQTVDVFFAGAWERNTIVGEPKLVTMTLKLQETPSDSAETLTEFASLKVGIALSQFGFVSLEPAE